MHENHTYFWMNFIILICLWFNCNYSAPPEAVFTRQVLPEPPESDARFWAVTSGHVQTFRAGRRPAALSLSCMCIPSSLRRSPGGGTQGGAPPRFSIDYLSLWKNLHKFDPSLRKNSSENWKCNCINLPLWVYAWLLYAVTCT